MDYDINDKIVVLPFYGEFGWMVMSHIRHVHALKSNHKIVCCEKGMECLFPSANGFFFDWTPPQPDNKKCGYFGYGYSNCVAYDKVLTDILRKAYPGHRIYRPAKYDCHWHTSDSIKFRPRVKPELMPVDICFGARKREFVKEKNWEHWKQTASALRHFGLTVGIAGSKDTSFTDIVADVVAWDHSGGDTEGTVDLLNNSRFYLGTDTGVSHLAALLDIPMLVFRKDHPGNDNLLGVMERANKTYCRKLGDKSWYNPDEVLGATIRCFNEGSFYAYDGIDKWILERSIAPKKGVFVEVGASDGKSGSNSLAFELRGWTGVIVEPDPRRNLSWRKCHVEKVAAAAFDGEVDFCQAAWADHSGINRNGAKIKVPCKRLDTILSEQNIKSIDLLSIDTEGTELDVWKGLDKRKIKPRVVIIEWNTAGLPSRKAEIGDEMTRSGYEIVADIGGNLICVNQNE